MFNLKKILFTPGIASIEALGSITRLIAIADEIKKSSKTAAYYLELQEEKRTMPQPADIRLYKDISHLYQNYGSKKIIILLKKVHTHINFLLAAYVM